MFVPYEEDDIAGIKVPLDFLDGRIVRDANASIIYYRNVLLPRRFDVLRPDRRLAAQLGFFENPPGLLLSFIGGYIRGGFIGLRSNVRKAVTRKATSPRWDWIPSAKGESSSYRDNWKLITTWNLR
jgi:hypothetical protein